jgi:hypothetical protein
MNEPDLPEKLILSTQIVPDELTVYTNRVVINRLIDCLAYERQMRKELEKIVDRLHRIDVLNDAFSIADKVPDDYQTMPQNMKDLYKILSQDPQVDRDKLDELKVDRDKLDDLMKESTQPPSPSFNLNLEVYNYDTYGDFHIAISAHDKILSEHQAMFIKIYVEKALQFYEKYKNRN